MADSSSQPSSEDDFGKFQLQLSLRKACLVNRVAYHAALEQGFGPVKGETIEKVSLHSDALHHFPVTAAQHCELSHSPHKQGCQEQGQKRFHPRPADMAEDIAPQEAADRFARDGHGNGQHRRGSGQGLRAVLCTLNAALFLLLSVPVLQKRQGAALSHHSEIESGQERD